MKKILGSFLITLVVWSIGMARALAIEHVPQGIFLSTEFPAVTLQAGQTSHINLQLVNKNIPPQRLNLTVNNVPKDWQAVLLGNGQPVAAAMPGFDDTLDLRLRLDIPADTTSGPHTLVVNASGNGVSQQLPIQISLADTLPTKLSVQTELPQLTGTTKTNFEYQLTIRNDSGKDALVSLDAKLPRYFDAYFTEGYGSQQISAVPIKAGESKTVKMTVRPPATAKTGSHQLAVLATADGVTARQTLTLELTGQPKLTLLGRNGRMSAAAQINEKTSVPVVIHNTGSVAATDIQLQGRAPSGWQISFEPERIAQIEPGKQAETQAMITPSSKSLAGDYMVSVTARSQGQTANGDFRITVTTSTLWGITGIALIAIALLILVGAIVRYGRR